MNDSLSYTITIIMRGIQRYIHIGIYTHRCTIHTIDYERSNPALAVIDINNFCFITPCEEYVGNFNTLKHVDAVGKRLSSEQSTR